ncbi:MAG: cobalamin-dependent protein [Eubacterium sp.]
MSGEDRMIDQLIDAFVELDENLVNKLTKRALKSGIKPNEIIEAVNHALGEIGKGFESGEATLSDLMMSGILYEQIINSKDMHLYDQIEQTNRSGLILLGTIETDIHDIGKSIFKSGAIISGFKVIDLGVDISTDIFVKNIIKYQPDILGISVVLTKAIDHIKHTINTIQKEGLHENLKIVLGGSFLDEEITLDCGADGYANNIMDGVKLCQQWMEKRIKQ